MRERGEKHKAVPQRGRGLELPWAPQVSLVLGIGQSLRQPVCFCIIVLGGCGLS